MVKRKRTAEKVREVIRRALVYTHPVDARRHVSRETWIIGKVPHAEYDIDIRLDHGAGQGHAELSLMVDIDGKRVAWEYVDVRNLVDHWAMKIVDEELRKRAAERSD